MWDIESTPGENTVSDAKAPITALLGMKAGMDADILVLGAPFDRKPDVVDGCVEGPATLRVAGQSLCLQQGHIFLHASREKALSRLSVSDAGDLVPQPAETVLEYLARLAMAVRTIASHGKKLLLLGGDHVVTLGALHGLTEIHHDFQVIHLDAHSDVQDLTPSSLPTNANFVSYAAELINTHPWIQLGVRAVGRHAPMFPPNVICTQPENLAARLQPCVPVYLTIDTDAFDPSLMPAVRYPVPRGLHYDDLDTILSALCQARCPLIGFDWVEFHPSCDMRPGLTAAAILAALIEILQLLEKQHSAP